MEGNEFRHRQEEALDDKSKDETGLGHAHCGVLSDGQKFCHKVMKDLFNSPTSGAVRRHGT